MTVENYGLRTPLPDAALRDARRRLAQTLRRDELVWLYDERYDQAEEVWWLTVLRTGAAGSWVRQRYRYDPQASVLHYRGESALSDEQFRQARARSAVFAVADWQDAQE